MFKKRMASVLSTVALSALAVGVVSPAYADGGGSDPANLPSGHVALEQYSGYDQLRQKIEAYRGVGGEVNLTKADPQFVGRGDIGAQLQEKSAQISAAADSVDAALAKYNADKDAYETSVANRKQIESENKDIEKANADAQKRYESDLAAWQKKNDAVEKHNQGVRERNKVKQDEYDKKLAAYNAAKKKQDDFIKDRTENGDPFEALVVDDDQQIPVAQPIVVNKGIVDTSVSFIGPSRDISVFSGGRKIANSTKTWLVKDVKPSDHLRVVKKKWANDIASGRALDLTVDTDNFVRLPSQYAASWWDGFSFRTGNDTSALAGISGIANVDMKFKLSYNDDGSDYDKPFYITGASLDWGDPSVVAEFVSPKENVLASFVPTGTYIGSSANQMVGEASKATPRAFFNNISKPNPYPADAFSAEDTKIQPKMAVSFLVNNGAKLAFGHALTPGISQYVNLCCSTSPATTIYNVATISTDLVMDAPKPLNLVIPPSLETEDPLPIDEKPVAPTPTPLKPVPDEATPPVATPVEVVVPNLWLKTPGVLDVNKIALKPAVNAGNGVSWTISVSNNGKAAEDLSGVAEALRNAPNNTDPATIDGYPSDELSDIFVTDTPDGCVDPTSVKIAGVVSGMSVTTDGEPSIYMADEVPDGVSFEGTSMHIASLAPGSSIHFLVTATASSDYACQATVNKAEVTGGVPTGGKTPPPSTSTVEIVHTPSIVATETASPKQTESVGQDVTFTVKVTNDSTVPLDTVSVTTTGFTGAGTPGELVCPATQLAPGASMDCTMTYKLTQDDVDKSEPITHKATAKGVSPEGEEVSADTTDFVLPPEAKPALSVEKSADKTTDLMAGETVTYTIKTTNTGNVTLHELGVAKAKFSGTGELNTSCDAPETLAVGASFECSATYVVTQGDIDAGVDVENIAVATGKSPKDVPVSSEGEEKVTPEAAKPALDVVKTPATDTKVKVGDKAVWNITATNIGNVTLHDVKVTDTSYSGAGEIELVCPNYFDGVLAPGGQIACVATAEVTQADVDANVGLENVADGSGIDPFDTVTTDTDKSVIEMATPTASIKLEKFADSALAKAGDEVTYTITATNTGTLSLANPKITEESFSGAGELGQLTCDEVETLRPGASFNCRVTYVATQADIDKSADITNEASVSAQPVAPGFEPVTNKASAVVEITPLADGVSVTKVADKTDAKIGDVINYTITVTNTGGRSLNQIKVTDDKFDGAGKLGAIDCGDFDGLLAPGATTTCKVTYSVIDGDSGKKITNQAQVSAKTPEGRDLDGKAEVTVNVAKKPSAKLPVTGGNGSLLALGLIAVTGIAAIGGFKMRKH